MWTLPNIITLIRICFTPVIALLPFIEGYWPKLIAFIIFLVAAVSDVYDGHLARSRNEVTDLGKMLDPIADKAMVVIALLVITGFSGMNPWILLPATLILFREVFVSGLREYLGTTAGLLKVTKLAKWKTTAQMVSIAVLFLGTGLEYLERGRGPMVGGLPALSDGPAGWATFVGICLLWIAAVLTVVTGWDYFAKALPHLRDRK